MGIIIRRERIRWVILVNGQTCASMRLYAKVMIIGLCQISWKGKLFVWKRIPLHLSHIHLFGQLMQMEEKNTGHTLENVLKGLIQEMFYMIYLHKILS